MKRTKRFSKITLALIPLAVVLAGALFLTGCASSDGGAGDRSAHQGSCY